MVQKTKKLKNKMKKSSKTSSFSPSFFKTFVELANVSMYVVEAKTARFLFANEHGCSQLGYSCSELTKKKVFEIEKTISDLKQWKEHVKMLKQQGAAFLEGIHLRADGSLMPVDVSLRYYDEKGSGYILAVVRNIAEQKRIEAVGVDRAKSEFASLASHQLRTPLTGIKWMLQEVLRKGDDLGEVLKEYIEDAFHSNERMIHLVNDLLNVSRLEAGEVLADSEELDLMEFIRTVVSDFSVLLKDRKQSVEITNPPKAILMKVDKHLLAEIMGRLISNALLYSEHGKTVQISAKLTSGQVKITVADQGVGISTADQKKLFTKFFRTHEATQLSTTGSGLSLYIIHKVLGLCNGKIEFKSKPKKGSTFTVTLPVEGPVNGKGGKGIVSKTIYNPMFSQS